MKKMKKFLIAGLLAVATCTAFMGAVTANAEAHIHSFENRRCTCGVYRLEGENADMSKVVSADAGGQGTLIEDVPTASGGKSFGNWSVAGNIVEWRFSIDRETTASITLALASCGSGTTLTESHALIVNGVTGLLLPCCI